MKSDFGLLAQQSGMKSSIDLKDRVSKRKPIWNPLNKQTKNTRMVSNNNSITSTSYIYICREKL